MTERPSSNPLGDIFEKVKSGAKEKVGGFLDAQREMSTIVADSLKGQKREKTEVVNEDKYPLGQYKSKDGKTPDWEKTMTAKPREVSKKLLLEGGVDRIRHLKFKNRGPEWYKDKAAVAKIFVVLNNAGRVDCKSFGLDENAKQKAAGIIQKMADMQGFNGKAWRQMIKEGGYSDDEIYGERGVLNMLLALQRAVATLPAASLETKNFKNGGSLENTSLKLSIKEGEDPKGRFTKINKVVITKQSTGEAITGEMPDGTGRAVGEIPDATGKAVGEMPDAPGRAVGEIPGNP